MPVDTTSQLSTPYGLPVIGGTALPPTVTKRQLSLALHALGKLDEAETAIEADAMAKIDWASQVNIPADGAIITVLKAALPLNDDEVKALYLSGQTYWN